MRRRALTAGLALIGLLSLSSVAPATAQATKEADMTKITVTVGATVLSATLDDSPAGRDFAALLPLELELSDYHGIEKVADLPRKLDTTGAPAAYKPETGDITLYAPWGNLAIFYKPFSSSRGLVRLGAFDGALDALLQDGPVTARFERAE
ncbi:cyclophilin-like fold protein [Pseudooceanicola sp. 200-1SW]|uniref:cyclophilin-like fold protein n=1 Tax=Pseudooceanicola sp. 200-1SW TaxID=3425949 RepID=UPI003D7F8B77